MVWCVLVMLSTLSFILFFFNDTATTEIYTLSLHDALPIAGKGSRQVQSLFKYFNSFMDADKNGFDVLIADEAHRLRETSANRWTKAEHRTGKAQVDELIDAARVPVFLLDQNQVVRLGELGTVEDIEKAARERGLEVHHVDLSAQYRCGGSETYID